MEIKTKNEFVEWYNRQPKTTYKSIVINGVDIEFQQALFFEDTVVFMKPNISAYIGGIEYGNIRTIEIKESWQCF